MANRKIKKVKTFRQREQEAIERSQPHQEALIERLRRDCPELLNSGAVKFMTLEERKTHYLEQRGVTLFEKYGHNIEEYAKFTFTTKDGRTFGWHFDGHRILHLIIAETGISTRQDKADLDRINSIEGMILENGAPEPPFVFDNDQAMCKAWVELHAVYGVLLTEEEIDIIKNGFDFDLSPYFEGDDLEAA